MSNALWSILLNLVTLFGQLSMKDFFFLALNMKWSFRSCRNIGRPWVTFLQGRSIEIIKMRRHDIQHNDFKHSDTQHKVLTSITLGTRTRYHYADCNYADCRVLFIVMLNVIMLGVIMLSVIMLSVVVPSIHIEREHGWDKILAWHHYIISLLSLIKTLFVVHF